MYTSIVGQLHICIFLLFVAGSSWAYKCIYMYLCMLLYTCVVIRTQTLVPGVEGVLEDCIGEVSSVGGVLVKFCRVKLPVSNFAI